MHSISDSVLVCVAMHADRASQCADGNRCDSGTKEKDNFCVHDNNAGKTGKVNIVITEKAKKTTKVWRY